VIGLTEEGIQKIGVWHSVRGMVDFSNETFTDDDEFFEMMEEDGSGSIYGKHLKVLLSPNKPYASLKKNDSKYKGNDKYEGFGIDLIHELSERIGFDYEFVIQEDRTSGSKHSFTGEWSGMVGKLINKVSCDSL
jgi:ionotropic glutamate receptor